MSSSLIDLLIFAFPPFLSFILTLLMVKNWIPLAHKIGLVGKDMNKLDKRPVAEAGGVWVILGISFGLLFYVFLRRYVTGREAYLVEIFAVITLELLASFLGFLDSILGWKKGLKPWQKVFFTFPLALPLVVVRAGYTTISIPFFGELDLGVFYPLVLVPIGIVGASNGFNMLAGYNGLEAGMGILLMIGVLLKAYTTGRLWVAYMALIAIASLSAFLYYNWYPAKVFPGDSLTHAIGAYYASLLILGNMEKFGIFLFLPYFMDAFLYFKAKVIERRRGSIEAFAKVLPDGSLDLPYEKIYDTTHIAIYILKKLKGKVYEKDVVLFIYFIEVIVIVTAFVIF